METPEHFAAVVQVAAPPPPTSAALCVACDQQQQQHDGGGGVDSGGGDCGAGEDVDVMLQEGLGMENLPYMGGAAVRRNVCS